MEQEPILNEHNLAESESKANPICFAEPKQGHESADAYGWIEHTPKTQIGAFIVIGCCLLPIQRLRFT